MANFQNDVYNIETKERFLNTQDLEKYPPRWWERVFEKTYFFEEKKQKDLFNFTVPEILEFYKFLDVGSITPLSIYNANLIKYGQWGLNENMVIDGANHFDEIDTETLVLCVNTTKIEQSILSYDKFLDLIQEHITNYQDKFVLFALFEGIKGKDYEEISNLKLEDINSKARIVTLNTGRSMLVSKEFIDICIKADAEETYIRLGDEQEVKLLPGEFIFKLKNNSRGLKINQTIYRTIYRNVRAVNELSYVVSSKSLRDSGMIYYLHKRAKELNISAEELLEKVDECQDIIDKYQFNVKAKRRWMYQFKNYLH